MRETNAKHLTNAPHLTNALNRNLELQGPESLRKGMKIDLESPPGGQPRKRDLARSVWSRKP